MQKNVVDACLRNRVPLVVVSSWNVYAGYEGEVAANERTPLRPAGTYGHAKALCEDLVTRMRLHEGLRCTLLRAGPIYGLGNTQPRFIYNFIDKALAGAEIVTHAYPDGDPCLDLVWADDFQRRSPAR